MREDNLILDCNNNILKGGILKSSIPIFYKCGTHSLPSNISLTFQEAQTNSSPFFHATADKLFRLLRCADPLRVTPSVRKLFDDITSASTSGKEFTSRPYRFRVSSPPEDIVFNYEVVIDFICLDNKPVLHIVCTHNHFGNFIWLKSKSAQDIWLTFIEYWSTFYSGHFNKT